MQRLLLVALMIGVFVAVVQATSAPTFCKCTCFKNSTIIPLGPASKTESQPSSDSGSPLQLRLRSASDPIFDTDILRSRDVEPRSASTSCSACTKAFCLGQGIDFCKDAKEADVITQCFQRDSNKDKIIVWGFTMGTLGLLGWAAFKKFVDYRDARAIQRPEIDYGPVEGLR